MVECLLNHHCVNGGFLVLYKLYIVQTLHAPTLSTSSSSLWYRKYEDIASDPKACSNAWRSLFRSNLQGLSISNTARFMHTPGSQRHTTTSISRLHAEHVSPIRHFGCVGTCLLESCRPSPSLPRTTTTCWTFVPRRISSAYARHRCSNARSRLWVVSHQHLRW